MDEQVGGMLRANVAGRDLFVDEDGAIVGRRDDATIRVDHELVSRSHAVLRRTETAWVLVDLGVEQRHLRRRCARRARGDHLDGRGAPGRSRHRAARRAPRAGTRPVPAPAASYRAAGGRDAQRDLPARDHRRPHRPRARQRSRGRRPARVALPRRAPRGRRAARRRSSTSAATTARSSTVASSAAPR